MYYNFLTSPSDMVVCPLFLYGDLFINVLMFVLFIACRLKEVVRLGP